MLELMKARWFGTKSPDSSARMPPVSIAELTMLGGFVPPCCSHIALCDGACLDAQIDKADDSAPSAGDDTK